jgi:hypothetical protein
MRGTIFVLLALAVGCSEPDPCAQHSGTCLNLEVRGALTKRVDELRLTLSDTAHAVAESSQVATPVSLPARVPVLLDGFSGDVEITTVARLHGHDLGGGTLPPIHLVPGTHSSASLQLQGDNLQFNLFQGDTSIAAADVSTFTFWDVADFNRDHVPDIFALKTAHTMALGIELYILDGAHRYQPFLFSHALPVSYMDTRYYQWSVADYNHDGTPDLFMIQVNTTSTSTVEVHVLDGAQSFASYLLGTATAVSLADGGDAQWYTGDFDNNGITDLIGVKTSATASDTVEVVVINGGMANGNPEFKSLLLPATGTPISTADSSHYKWHVADYDGDGIVDLIGIQTDSSSSGFVEAQVLGGASHFQSFLLRRATPISSADGSSLFQSWKLADYDGDGLLDLIGVKTSATPLATLGVQILGGAE